MAQMNKRTNTRRSQLEDELVADISDHQANVVDTGKRENLNVPYAAIKQAEYRIMNIQQGHRRRHPLRVLNQHKAMTQTTEDAQSVWEQALTQDDQRTHLPEIYRSDQMKLMSTQIGLQELADKSYKDRKNKMAKLSTVINN
jgi:hypothetical protein